MNQPFVVTGPGVWNMPSPPPPRKYSSPIAESVSAFDWFVTATSGALRPNFTVNASSVAALYACWNQSGLAPIVAMAEPTERPPSEFGAQP